jgi:hypothetical protein
MRRALPSFLAAVVVLLLAAPAHADLNDPADQWLPSSDGAEWVYAWSNSDYQPAPRTEKYTVQSRNGTAFRLAWAEQNAGPYDTPSSGTIDFRYSDAGLVNLNYQSTQPPPNFPILCASATSCGNSVAGAMYLLIWGTRSPTLAEPLLSGTRWNSLGGAGNDVASASRYVGHDKVTVPAFPKGVDAAKVEAEITQAGAVGDPFGSGVRTTWWVRGVGPVKVTMRHAGGELSTAELQSTTLKPLALPPDENLLPLNRGDVARFRWRNSKHMTAWSTQDLTVSAVVNASAQVDVKRVSGPINVAGAYTLSTRLSGVTQLSASTQAATRAKFPALGPRSAASMDRRRFFTPYDFMTYGFGPVVPVYAKAGYTWRSSRDTRDWKIFGVTGKSTVGKPVKVKVRAGTFTAVPVKSTLTQSGFPFGSGTRTSYFAPGKGLVKLVFKHKDGSVSTVERVK